MAEEKEKIAVGDEIVGDDGQKYRIIGPPIVLEDGTVIQRKKPIIPEGMTKGQWKKMVKHQRWLGMKDKVRNDRKERKKELKKRILQMQAAGEDISALVPKKEGVPHVRLEDQKESGAKVIVDCGFDELMTQKEVVSLSNQLARTYAANKNDAYRVGLTFSSFGQRLKQRFDDDIDEYRHWSEQHITITDKSLEEVLAEHGGAENAVYLSADTDEMLEGLEPGKTYIIGGIVDKGRHKNLCKEKAESLGIPVRRLPIDECIKMSGRKVLATSHVAELLIRWFEFEDWTKAFEAVLPARKFKPETPKHSRRLKAEARKAEAEAAAKEKEAATTESSDAAE